MAICVSDRLNAADLQHLKIPDFRHPGISRIGEKSSPEFNYFRCFFRSMEEDESKSFFRKNCEICRKIYRALLSMEDA